MAGFGPRAKGLSETHL